MIFYYLKKLPSSNSQSKMFNTNFIRKLYTKYLFNSFTIQRLTWIIDTIDNLRIRQLKHVLCNNYAELREICIFNYMSNVPNDVKNAALNVPTTSRHLQMVESCDHDLPIRKHQDDSVDFERSGQRRTLIRRCWRPSASNITINHDYIGMITIIPGNDHVFVVSYVKWRVLVRKRANDHPMVQNIWDIRVHQSIAGNACITINVWHGTKDVCNHFWCARFALEQ